MKKITSRTNQTIKDIYALHSKKGRMKQRCFIAEGVRTIQTLLASSIKLKQLYITEDLPIEIACPSDQITRVAQEVMQKISTVTTPSGYLAVCAIPSKPQQALEHGLVLAQISDPGNMGTLIRSATALAAQAVVIVEGVDPWSPKVIHATAGTIGSIALYQYSWQELLEAKGTTKLYALVVNNGTSIENHKVSRALVVVGNESHGIPDDWIIDCDEQITIAMPGKTESLNAAVAGSIALYLMQKHTA